MGIAPTGHHGLALRVEQEAIHGAGSHVAG